MSKAFILIPGARLPEAIVGDILPRLSANQREALERLGENVQEVTAQRLDDGAYRRAPHLLWLWRVLTRRQTPPQEAPWRWLALGARPQAPQMFCLETLTLNDDGTITAVNPALDDDTFMSLTLLIEPALLKAGFRLQLWDGTWFVTRQQDWDAVSSAAAGLVGLTREQAPVSGEDAPKALALMNELAEKLRQSPINQTRRDAGLPTVDAIWLSGAGHEQLFFPPTLIRSVACNDDAVLGWANASGILKERLGKHTGRWPDDIPSGDVIAVVDDLYEPWLKQDWDAWAHALPAMADAVQSYLSDAARMHADDPVVVAFGLGGSATMMPSRPSLLGRFFKPAAVSPEQWCPDTY